MGTIKGPRWTRGFKKSRLVVDVENAKGQRRNILTATDTEIRLDKRKRKRQDYVTLITINHTPRFVATYNLASRKDSIVSYLHPTSAYAKIDQDKAMKLLAFSLHALSLFKIPIFSENDIQLLSAHPVIKWYLDQFNEKINDARRSWFRSKRAKGRNLGRPRRRRRHDV